MDRNALPHIRKRQILSGAFGAVSAAVLLVVSLIEKLRQNPTLTRVRLVREQMETANINFGQVFSSSDELRQIESKAHLQTAAHWLKHSRTSKCPNLKAVDFVEEHLCAAEAKPEAVGTTDEELEKLQEDMRRRRRSTLAKIRRKKGSGRQAKLREIDHADTDGSIATEQPISFGAGESSGLNTWETAVAPEERELAEA